MRSPWRIWVAVFMLICGTPHFAQAAWSALQCQAGSPVAGTSLYNDSTDANGACQNVSFSQLNIFSTIICQFTITINVIMGKLFCSIQAAIAPILAIVFVIFIMIYGAQMLMGTAQLNTRDAIPRILKLSMVIWLTTDNTGGVSSAISYVFDFFLAFITTTTAWVIKLLNMNTTVFAQVDYAGNPNVSSLFFFLDTWFWNALTGSLSSANGRVMGFFVGMIAIMPSLAWFAFYFLLSTFMMLIRTLISFLMALVAIAFLLGLSPIFISFMLFQFTFSFFDTWVRFMMAFSLQVMVSFAILTLWIFSLTLFEPFFDELSQVIFPYEKVWRPATTVYDPVIKWGLCPLNVWTDGNNTPHIACQNSNFDPQNVKDDHDIVVPPEKVPELQDLIYYLMYNLVTLLIVSYGFASLQKNSQDISRQLAGAVYVPILNGVGMGGNTFGSIARGKSEANKFMSKGLFSGFNRRHGAADGPSEQFSQQIGNMLGQRQ